MLKQFWFIVVYLPLLVTGHFIFRPSIQDDCTDENGEPGVCVKTTECPKALQMVREGLTEATINYLKKIRCGFESKEDKVCCEKQSGQQAPIPISVVIQRKSETLVTTLLSPENEMWPTRTECADTGQNYRVTGGNETQLGEYQFAVLLHRPNDFYCGGSLINHWYVLTAAHCLSEKPDFVRLGEWNLKTDKDCDPEEPDTCSDPVMDIKIENMIVHESFDPSTYENDVGLLRLQERVEYTEWIKPVCLPRSKEEKKKLATGQKITTMGWGRINGMSRQRSDVLVKADIEIKKNGYCSAKLDVAPESSQFCAGSNDGRDSCGGDSGGPTIMTAGSKYYYLQLGIVSAGTLHCGMKGSPSVYSNVVDLMGWINAKVGFQEPKEENVREHTEYEGKWPSFEECKVNGDLYRITKGHIAGLGEFPFMATILRKKPDQEAKFDCGGSLINNRYVLTAAHCAPYITDVRLGEWNTKTEKDCDEDNEVCADPFKQIKPQEIIVHPKYDKITYTNDIALIRLEETVQYTKWISPVCLPRLAAEKRIVNESVTVMGWGYISKERFKKPDILLKARLDVLERKVCDSKYDIDLLQSQLCAGTDDGTDSCSGDSGGPAILESRKGPRHNTLVGIVSRGHKECGTEGYPAIYTNVASYLDWIEESVIP